MAFISFVSCINLKFTVSTYLMSAAIFHLFNESEVG